MDNLNSVGDFIKSVFSTLVNKDDRIFKALFASGKDEPPGTTEMIFTDVEKTRDKWCNTPCVYEQEGETLEKTLSLFSVLTRSFDESDTSLKERNRILYVRNKDTVWGDKWNILKMFKSFFQSEFVYIVNNTNDKAENLLSDGDFEENDGAWALESCGYSGEARFSERYGIKFVNYGKCSQAAGVEAGSAYFLHFFQNGKLDVQITDNNGRYWKPPVPYADDFGSWVTAQHKIRVDGLPGKWEPGSVYFLTDDTVSSVTISFMGVAGETHLDYVRLFKKEAYPTFTLICVFGGRYTPDTMGMAPGSGDPIVAGDGDTPLAPQEEDEPCTTVDYGKMSYLDQSHLFGAEGAYAKSVSAELLEIVQAGGIPSYIEILIRESDEQEENYV